jgi:hypothetical protein
MWIGHADLSWIANYWLSSSAFAWRSFPPQISCHLETPNIRPYRRPLLIDAIVSPNLQKSNDSEKCYTSFFSSRKYGDGLSLCSNLPHWSNAGTKFVRDLSKVGKRNRSLWEKGRPKQGKLFLLCRRCMDAIAYSKGENERVSTSNEIVHGTKCQCFRIEQACIGKVVKRLFEERLA